MNSLIILRDGTRIIDIVHSVREEHDGYCTTCYMEYTVSELRFVVENGKDIIQDDMYNFDELVTVGQLMRLFGNHMLLVSSLDREAFSSLIYELSAINGCGISYYLSECRYSFSDISETIPKGVFIDLIKDVMI